MTFLCWYSITFHSPPRDRWCNQVGFCNRLHLLHLTTSPPFWLIYVRERLMTGVREHGVGPFSRFWPFEPEWRSSTTLLNQHIFQEILLMRLEIRNLEIPKDSQRFAWDSWWKHSKALGYWKCLEARKSPDFDLVTHKTAGVPWRR